jgi:hypothetical protein
MALNFKVRKKENDYFEIFGPSKDEVHCFLFQERGDHKFGESIFLHWSNILQTIFDIIEFLFVKIIPRFAIAVIAGLLLSAILNEFVTSKGQLLIYLILQILIFVYFPPSVETLYLIEKTEYDDDTFLKLLYCSKNMSSGICTYKKPFVLKDKCRSALKRIAENLSRYIDFDMYKIIYHNKTKKEFENHYKLLTTQKH